MSNAILEKSLTNASNIDEVSCDQEVWEINSKGEGRRKSISSEKSKARTKAKSRAEMRENSLLDLQNAKLVRNSPLPVCDSCRDLKQEYICHKKKMETNLTILKEKIVTTDELIKNYHKKCQENEKLVKKVADLSEKLKKCYGETGAMRIQLEKARQANEPLKKTAKRFEVEKVMAEEQVADLTERLRLAESKLGDSVCKSAVQDAKSSTLTKNLSQLAKENESLKERLLSFQEEKEQLKIELKTNKATNRKSQFAAKSADRKYSKSTKKLNFYKEKYENLRRDLSYESPKKNGTRNKTTAKKNEAKKATRAIASQDSTKNSFLEASTLNDEIGDQQADKTSSEEDLEVANFLQKYSKGALRNVKSPSPPLSPIPPSPVPQVMIPPSLIPLSTLPCESSDRIIASVKASGPVTDNSDDDYAWMNLSDDSSDSSEEMNSPGLPDVDSEQEDLFLERSWSPVKSSIFETLRSSDAKRKQRRFSEPSSLFSTKYHADQVSSEPLSRNKSLNDVPSVVEISFKRESADALKLSAATDGDVEDSVVWDEWNHGTSEKLERCEDNIAPDFEMSLQCIDTANCKESTLKEDSEMASVIWNESQATDQVKDTKRRRRSDISTEIGADSLPSKKLCRLTRSRLKEMTKESHFDDSIIVAGPSCDNKALPECNEKSENLLTKPLFDKTQGVGEGLSDNIECSVKTNIISNSKGSTEDNSAESTMHTNLDSATDSKEVNLLEKTVKTLDMCVDGCEVPEAQVNEDVAIKNIESLSKIEELKDESIQGSTNIDAKAGCFDKVKDIEERPVENPTACINSTLTDISVSKSTTEIGVADNEESISNQKENKDIDGKHCMEILNDAEKVANSLESTVVDLNDVCLARDECKVADAKQTLKCDSEKLNQSKELIHKSCVSKDDKSTVCVKPTYDKASENTLTVTKENTICSITNKVSVYDGKAANEQVTETKTQLNLNLHDKPRLGINRGNFLDRRSAIIKNDTIKRKGEKTTIPLIDQLKHARKTAAGIRNRARNSLLNDIRKQITSSPSKEQSVTDGCAGDGAGFINMIEKSPASLHQTTSNIGCDKENLIVDKTDCVTRGPVPLSDKGNGMYQQAVTECITAVSGDVCEKTNVFVAECENISVPKSLLHQEDVSPDQRVKTFDTVITENLSDNTNLMVDRCENDNMLPISVSQKGSALPQNLLKATDSTTSGKRIDKTDLNVDKCELENIVPVAVSKQNVFSNHAAKVVENYIPDELCATTDVAVNETDSGKSMPIVVSKQASVVPGKGADKTFDTAAGLEGDMIMPIAVSKQGDAVPHQMIQGCVTIEPERCEKTDLAVKSLTSVPNLTSKEKVKRKSVSTRHEVKSDDLADPCSVQSNKPMISKSTESSTSLSQSVPKTDGASSIQAIDHTVTAISDKVLVHDECDKMKDISTKVTKICAQSHASESIVNATPDRQQSLGAKRYVGYEDTIGESSSEVSDNRNLSAATAVRVEDIINVIPKTAHYQVENCLKIPEAEQFRSSCDAEKNTNRASTEVSSKDNHQQTASTRSAGQLEAGFLLTEISKPDNRTEPSNLNYSGPEHNRTRFCGSRSHRLSTENIIELVSISSLTVSPLPPSPPRQRVTPLLSPLPVTPQPELLSPLCSSPEILSPPTLRDAPSDCLSSRGVFAPKPVAVRPSTTIRALDFKFNENKHSFKRVARTKSNKSRLLDIADHSDGNTRCRLSDVAVSSASNPSNPSTGRNEQKIAANANTRPRKRSLSSELALDIASERTKMRFKDGVISGSRAGKKTRFLEKLPEKIDAVKTQESRDNKTDTLKDTIDQKGIEVGHKKSLKSDKASHNSDESASKSNIENCLSDRRKHQSEPAYVKYCFGSLKNGAKLSDVSSKLSVFKNISSSTAVVSAIIAYLKTSDEDLVQSLFCKLNCCSEASCTKDHKLANKMAKGTKNSVKIDQVVNEFTRRPFFTEMEERIVLLVAETEKIQHLNAVSKMLLQLIPRAIFSEEPLSDCGLQSLCRLFSSLCRLVNEAEQLRGLIFNVAYSRHLSSRLGVVLLCCFGVWPMIFESNFPCNQRDIDQQSILSSPLSCTIQIIATWIAMKQEQLPYAEALQSIFGWSFTKESGLSALSNSLLAIIGIEGQIQGKTMERDRLQNKLEFDILKSLELVAVHMGWEWCNNYLIAERLWGIFRDWNKGLGTSTSSENDVADTTIINAIKLIGCVSRIGINGGHHFRTPKCFTTFMMACIGILQKSQLNSKVSLAVQIAAAYTLVNLSPVNPQKVSTILYAWLQQKVGKEVPHDLRRAAASIAAQNMV